MHLSRKKPPPPVEVPKEVSALPVVLPVPVLQAASFVGQPVTSSPPPITTVSEPMPPASGPTGPDPEPHDEPRGYGTIDEGPEEPPCDCNVASVFCHSCGSLYCSYCGDGCSPFCDGDSWGECDEAEDDLEEDDPEPEEDPEPEDFEEDDLDDEDDWEDEDE
jgi:hypothetical protein